MYYVLVVEITGMGSNAVLGFGMDNIVVARSRMGMGNIVVLNTGMGSIGL